MLIRDSTGIDGGVKLGPLQKKKFKRFLEKLKRVPGLSEAERAVYALSLASTPDERWARMRHFLHLHTCSRPWIGKKSGF